MRWWCLVLVLTWVPSCAPTNREDLAKEVLKADPEFADVLEKHQELANRIETSQRELTLKRTTVQRTIIQLQKDLAAAAMNVRSRIAETKKKMDPDRKRLELALDKAGQELQAKREQRAELGRQMTQLRKAIKSGSAVWSAQERARQNLQLEEMLQDAKRLDQEMANLKQHVRLLKIKLLLIKL